MTLTPGQYRYELRRGGEIIGRESAIVTIGGIHGERIVSAGGEARFEVDAELAEGAVISLKLWYSRGPFTRNAAYRVDGEMLRGQVSAMAGAAATEGKLGRFREIDAGLTVFKALLVGHLAERGSGRWTGRVAMIDPSTLMVRSNKQTWFQSEQNSSEWLGEPSLGERERIELDAEGRVTRRIDSAGTEFRLIGTS